MRFSSINFRHIRATYSALVLAALLIGASLGPAFSQGRAKLSHSEFASQLQLAEVYEQTRDFDNAVRVYEQLYESDSTNTSVFNGLLRGYIAQKHFDAAQKLLTARIAASPTDFELYLLLGRTEAFLSHRDAALAAFQKAEDLLGSNCLQLTQAASALVDVSYIPEATALLEKITSQHDPECAGIAASLYLRIGQYGEATKQYLVLLAAGESNLPIVEQRIAQFTSDSAARALTLEALRGSIDQSKPSLTSLQLLAWMYGEEKDYADAYALMLQIDSLDGGAHGSQGYELLNFADRARAEGALDVAVKAYDVAIRRIKANPNVTNEYFLNQAVLGSLRTRETFLMKQSAASRAIDTAQVLALVHDLEAFGASKSANEFALVALVHAGNLCYTTLFDLARASRDYDETLARARGYSSMLQEAHFGLAEVAMASNNLALASSRLDKIDQLLDKRDRPEDKELRMHALYDRALVAYYSENFDSSRHALSQIIDEPGSDYANDAIQLASTLDENHSQLNLPVLKQYAAAQFDEVQRNYPAALTRYAAIVGGSATAPLADDAALHLAELQVKLGKPLEAIGTLDTMQQKMLSSPLLDVAAFREAEIVERELHDKARAQKMYEEFLVRFQHSTFDADARDRARRLRGDVF